MKPLTLAHSFIHALSKHLRTYCVPGITLGSGSAAMAKTDEELEVQRRGQDSHSNCVRKGGVGHDVTESGPGSDSIRMRT